MRIPEPTLGLILALAALVFVVFHVLTATDSRADHDYLEPAEQSTGAPV